MSAFALFVAGAISATARAGEELRLGLFVGNDQGAPGEPSLLFATADARKMRDLFVDWGGIDEADALLLLDRPTKQVLDAFDQVERRLKDAKAKGQPTSFVFYYSGHGDDQALKLGTTRLDHGLLRDRLEASGADVRVALLDACQSGGAIREKGGSMGPGYAFAVKAERVRGTAFLTASAHSELAQESTDLTGGLFTYFLHGGLLGAADADADGQVSLTEAYLYVHAGTSMRARDARHQQTPHFDLDLTGSGELVLTRLTEAQAWIGFAPGLSGAWSVWDDGRKRYVAEVDAGSGQRVAVAAGTYALQQRLPGWVDEAVLTVQPGEVALVRETDLRSVAYEDTISRGAIERQVRRARAPDLALRLSFGSRAFPAGSVYALQYLPEHAIGGIDARWRPDNRKVYWGVDLLSGAGGGTLHFAERGEKAVFVQSTSLGGRFGAATHWRALHAGIGLKGELIHFRRSFPDEELGPQAALALAPGLNTWFGLEYGRFVADLNVNSLWLTVQLDDLPGRPRYAEGLLSLGWRF